MRRRRALLLIVSVVALALLWPQLSSVYREVGTIGDVAPGWLVAIAFTVTVQMVSNWELHRILLRTSRWFDVATPQLTGNAASHLFPGGNAIGAGIQVRMLTTAGFEVTRVATSLGAFSILGTVSGFVVLPFVVLLASAAGSRIDARLIVAMWIGAAVLLVVLIAIVAAVRRDGPWRHVARVVSWGERRLHRPTNVAELEQRLLRERDHIRDALRDRAAIVAFISLTRPLCDYLTLLLSLRAVGANVNPAAVLAAFIVSNIAGMIPLTPGGLGFVEASLDGVLIVAGTSTVDAHLAVAIYRVAETWLPCVAGAVAVVWFRRRHRDPAAALAVTPSDR